MKQAFQFYQNQIFYFRFSWVMELETRVLVISLTKPSGLFRTLPWSITTSQVGRNWFKKKMIYGPIFQHQKVFQHFDWIGGWFVKIMFCKTSKCKHKDWNFRPPLFLKYIFIPSVWSTTKTNEQWRSCSLNEFIKSASSPFSMTRLGSCFSWLITEWS